MAQRPLFISSIDNEYLVKTDIIDFTYHNGFSVIQKQRSIQSLHEAINQKYGFKRILEVSSKSEEPLGIALSAFNLMIKHDKLNVEYSVECAFQASKVFSYGGPYKDLLKVTSREAKKDPRIRESGELLNFELYNQVWQLEPLTAFYDWLYINALKQNTQYHEELLKYEAFTDIEFNPIKSINCQAYSIAMFCALYKKEMLENVRDSQSFLNLYKEFKISNSSLLNKSVKQQKKLNL